MELETSIEIASDGTAYYGGLPEDAVISFLLAFALTAEKEDYNYLKMNDGMVNFNKKEIVISFRIEFNEACFFVKNMLSSIDFAKAKKLIGAMFGL